MAARDAGDRALLGAAAVFTTAVLLHGADHARRGVDTIDIDVFWAGMSAMVLEIVVVSLIAARHRVAPLAAAVAGWSLAAGYVVVHFFPQRSWLSDSLTDGIDVSALSWAAATVEVAAAVLLGAVGVWVLRRRGGLASAAEAWPAQLTWTAGLTHPVSLAMLGGNAIILAISIFQF